MALDIDPFKLTTAVNVAVTAVIAFVLWLRKPGEDAGRAVHGLREEILQLHHDMDRRMVTLEERVKHMPSTEELREVEGAVKQVDARVQAQGERIGSMHAAVSRIEQHLLTRN